MARVTLTPAQVPRMVRQNNKRAKRGAAKGLQRAAHRGRGVLVRRTPVDQGQLKASWRVRKAMNTGIGSGNLAAMITNSAPHAGIVEAGARPHKVGLEGWMAIYDWARRNIKFTETLKSGPNKGQQSKPRRMSHDDYGNPMLEQITWGIVNRIAKFGQRPTWFVRDSMDILMRIAQEEVAKAVAKSLTPRRPPGGAK